MGSAARIAGLALALMLAPALGVFAQNPGPDQPETEVSGLYKCQKGSYPVARTALIRIRDEDRERDLDISVVFPESGGGKFPVIVWSHGAFGSKDGYAPLAEFWASHGYVVIRPTHSDSVKKGTIPSLKNVFAFDEWDIRPLEISLIVDQLSEIARRAPGLGSRLDAATVGMGGHSYGAHTAELLAGATTKVKFLGRGKRRSFKEERIAAFMMISPSGIGGVFDDKSFATMEKPTLMITGSNDTSGFTDQPVSWRLKSWEDMPAGDRFLLFLAGAYHGFGGIAGAVRFPGAGPPSQKQVDYVRCTGLAFWDAYLKKMPSAQEYLLSNATEEASKGEAGLKAK